jgi:uncharacterized membrane protein YczE
MSSNALIIYLLGALVLIAGIAYFAFLSHVPTKWIAALVIVFVGVAVLALSKKMGRGSGGATGV